MPDQEEAHSLNEVVERVAAAAHDPRTSVADVLHSIGHRSFGPLLLVPGLLLVSPLSGIPGLPSFGAAVIAIVSVHLLLGCRKVWLPGFLLRCSLPRRRLDLALHYLGPLTRPVDRLIRPRLTFLTEGLFARLIGLACLLIALLMPPLELVPMANTTTAAAVSVFALALVARDGVLALVAFGATGALGWLAAEAVLL